MAKTTPQESPSKQAPVGAAVAAPAAAPASAPAGDQGQDGVENKLSGCTSPLEDFRAELAVLMVAAEAKIREFVASAQQSIEATVAAVTDGMVPGTLELIAAPAAEAKPAALTVADVVKRVRRQTVLSDKGATRTVESRLSPDEVLTWHDHGSHIVVVTTDGQKFSSADAE